MTARPDGTSPPAELRRGEYALNAVDREGLLIDLPCSLRSADGKDHPIRLTDESTGVGLVSVGSQGTYALACPPFPASATVELGPRDDSFQPFLDERAELAAIVLVVVAAGAAVASVVLGRRGRSRVPAAAAEG